MAKSNETEKKVVMRVDIDAVAEEIAQWNKLMIDTDTNKKLLEKEVNILRKCCEDAEESKTFLKNEIRHLRCMVDQIQGSLSKRCDCEDENRKLKQRLKEMEEDDIKRNQDHQEKVDSMQAKLVELMNRHQQELTSTEKNVMQKCQAEIDRLETIVSEKMVLVEKLKNQMSQLEKDKQAELVGLRSEYDGKLLKIQKQNAKIQQTGQGNSAGSEIFRKKLKHIKEEHEKEVSSLKRTILVLEQKLNQRNASCSNISPASDKYPLSKRFKRM
ncbi:myosin heavy chain, embryonic smooth muscle isoform [Lingula anatina]|uniref:Myosin heavy chain, embryonic smooth muscle isoform n=1 Tax=Lingula anatina TaxID=7574 RepID=A0A1S3KHU8_LINAN|nr:myosin heavy chain, embryonic smooth muscle isoform [Lingula anatina]|eukprot:XP_013421801.1 myosin heavy chain, embryonic smooth muscle isoform [Lingula anatina]